MSRAALTQFPMLWPVGFVYSPSGGVVEAPGCVRVDRIHRDGSSCPTGVFVGERGGLEALLGGLAADAEGCADGGPGMPLLSGAVHGGGEGAFGGVDVAPRLIDPGQDVDLGGWVQPGRRQAFATTATS
jgi:hypothetical protein